MPRVKRSVHARKKRRKVLEQAKGYWGLKSTNYTYAKEQVERSLVYAYRDRKVKKREFRRLWIMRINAGARANGLSYNQFIAGLKAAEIELDRKVLADLATSDPAKFGEIAEQAKSALAAQRNSARRAEIFRRQAGYCDGRSPLYADSAAGSRTIRGSTRSRPTSAGTSRCACSAGCTTSCSRGEASWDDVGAALDEHARVPRALRRRAGRPDERGAARLGAPARVPLGRRRTAVRPARARPVRGPEPDLGPLPLPLRDGRVGDGRARAARRRPHAAAGGALRAPGRGRAPARHRPQPGRRDDGPRRAAAAVVRLARPDRTPRAAAPGDRDRCATIRPS